MKTKKISQTSLMMPVGLLASGWTRIAIVEVLSSYLLTIPNYSVETPSILAISCRPAAANPVAVSVIQGLNGGVKYKRYGDTVTIWIRQYSAGGSVVRLLGNNPSVLSETPPEDAIAI